MAKDIEELLADLENVTVKEDKSLEVKKPMDLDVTDKEELAEELIKVTREDRAMADKLFELFYPEIMSGMDRSQASKEAMTKALELKIMAGRNIIDLLKIMKTEEKVNNAIGVFINEKKAGIDLNFIKENYEEDE